MREFGLVGGLHGIPRRLFWDALKWVEGEGGPAGPDGVTIEQFGARREENLYVLWVELWSGGYWPGPVRVVGVPAVDVLGRYGARRLGIPNVVDRVAQRVAVMALQDSVEGVFHDDSYGCCPGRSSVDAVAVCRQRCSTMEWALVVGIRDFFESVRWDLVLELLVRHAQEEWVVLYVERWLQTPMVMADGSLLAREKGTLQGAPISSLIANLFLHYALDVWIAQEFPAVQFERFLDGLVIHCDSKLRASHVRASLAGRLVEVGLELDRDRTRIVSCRSSEHQGAREHVSFAFCGYEFPSGRALNEVEVQGAGGCWPQGTRLAVQGPCEGTPGYSSIGGAVHHPDERDHTRNAGGDWGAGR